MTRQHEEHSSNQVKEVTWQPRSWLQGGGVSVENQSAATSAPSWTGCWSAAGEPVPALHQSGGWTPGPSAAATNQSPALSHCTHISIHTCVTWPKVCGRLSKLTVSGFSHSSWCWTYCGDLVIKSNQVDFPNLEDFQYEIPHLTLKRPLDFTHLETEVSVLIHVFTDCGFWCWFVLSWGTFSFGLCWCPICLDLFYRQVCMFWHV